MTNETDVVVGRRAFLTRAAALSVLVAAGGPAACGRRGRPAGDDPVEVEPGDTCARCGMVISDMRHVGEIIGDRDVWKFDDVGELFIYRQEQGLSDGDVRATYVKGYDTGQWVEAGSAHYVVAPDVATPMGTHVLALAEEDSVGAYTVSESARERTYEEIPSDVSGARGGRGKPGRRAQATRVPRARVRAGVRRRRVAKAVDQPPRPSITSRVAGQKTRCRVGRRLPSSESGRLSSLSSQ